MTLDDQKKTEDDVQKLLEVMAPAHKQVMYKVLYAEGFRIDNVKDELRKIKEYTKLNLPTEQVPMDLSGLF